MFFECKCMYVHFYVMLYSINGSIDFAIWVVAMAIKNYQNDVVEGLDMRVFLFFGVLILRWLNQKRYIKLKYYGIIDLKKIYKKV